LKNDFYFHLILWGDNYLNTELNMSQNQDLVWWCDECRYNQPFNEQEGTICPNCGMIDSMHVTNQNAYFLYYKRTLDPSFKKRK
jgi:hypothetical protein